MLTIQVLTRNNAKTISACLESAARVGGRVIVGDMGSSDDTPHIARSMGAELVAVGDGGDMSDVRNGLCSGGPNMYLEPWERIARGAEAVGSMEGSRSFYVVSGGYVSKQVRLWDRGRFENPVFETVVGSGAVVDPSVVVVSEGQPDNRGQNTEACRRWAARKPTSPDPYYYLACCLLAEGRGREFMVEATKYLNLASGRDDSQVLMNYYLARQEFIEGDSRRAYQRAIECLFYHPSFAEFWCLLGDMLCSRGEYRRAVEMYQNARIAGKRRRNDDSFPIEISKYESYPSLMEEKCRKAVGGSFLVAPKRNRQP